MDGQENSEIPEMMTSSFSSNSKFSFNSNMLGASDKKEAMSVSALPYQLLTLQNDSLKFRKLRKNIPAKTVECHL